VIDLYLFRLDSIDFCIGDGGRRVECLNPLKKKKKESNKPILWSNIIGIEPLLRRMRRDIKGFSIPNDSNCNKIGLSAMLMI